MKKIEGHFCWPSVPSRPVPSVRPSVPSRPSVRPVRPSCPSVRPSYGTYGYIWMRHGSGNACQLPTYEHIWIAHENGTTCVLFYIWVHMNDAQIDKINFSHTYEHIRIRAKVHFRVPVLLMKHIWTGDGRIQFQQRTSTHSGAGEKVTLNINVVGKRCKNYLYLN